MISEDDGRMAFEYKDCFVIKSPDMIKRFGNGDSGIKCKDGFAYSSGTDNNVLSIEQTIMLIENNVTKKNKDIKNNWDLSDIYPISE